MRSTNEIFKELGIESLNQIESKNIFYCQNCGCTVTINKKSTVKKEEAMAEAKKKPKCPQCGGEANCYSRDIGGGNDFFDEYTLVCSQCGHVNYDVKYGGQKDQPSEEVTYCPFCGANCYAHQPPPQEFIRQNKSK